MPGSRLHDVAMGTERSASIGDAQRMLWFGWHTLRAVMHRVAESFDTHGVAAGQEDGMFRSRLSVSEQGKRLAPIAN